MIGCGRVCPYLSVKKATMTMGLVTTGLAGGLLFRGLPDGLGFGVVVGRLHGADG